MEVSMKRFLILALLAMVALPLEAQRRRARAAAPPPRLEFGADLVVGYERSSYEGQDESYVRAQFPFDVRVGYALDGRATVELRGSLDFQSGTGAGGGASYTARPGLNVTYGLGGGSSRGGLYATLGAAAVVSHYGGTSATQAAINGGVGTRWRKFRGEAFVANAFESATAGAPNELTVGVRLGLSIWQ
jgi:hypothetical protein